LPFKPPPPHLLCEQTGWLFKVLAIHPPPPSFYANHLGLKATSMLISLRNIAKEPTLNISCFIFYV
jgi:hypothetical protein